ncbi:hypothetical protein RRG08_054710 [Elysia crispata]|uniref:Uncharacterized protein n=1 Tax=Elysia crispata TaxID=231223 RepID=A0AAE1B170_9GAST|nr:hypothetical protein RRG08_054710 [Elysia crispata]
MPSQSFLPSRNFRHRSQIDEPTDSVPSTILATIKIGTFMTSHFVTPDARRFYRRKSKTNIVCAHHEDNPKLRNHSSRASCREVDDAGIGNNGQMIFGRAQVAGGVAPLSCDPDRKKAQIFFTPVINNYRRDCSGTQSHAFSTLSIRNEAQVLYSQLTFVDPSSLSALWELENKYQPTSGSN